MDEHRIGVLVLVSAFVSVRQQDAIDCTAGQHAYQVIEGVDFRCLCKVGNKVGVRPLEHLKWVTADNDRIGKRPLDLRLRIERLYHRKKIVCETVKTGINILAIAFTVLFGPKKVMIYQQRTKDGPFELVSDTSRRTKALEFSRASFQQTLKCVTDHTNDECKIRWKHTQRNKALKTTPQPTKKTRLMWGGLFCMRDIGVHYDDHDLKGTTISCTGTNKGITASVKVKLTWKGDREIPDAPSSGSTVTTPAPHSSITCGTGKAYLTANLLIECECNPRLQGYVTVTTSPAEIIPPSAGQSPLKFAFQPTPVFNGVVIKCQSSTESKVGEYLMKVAFGPSTVQLVAKYGKVREDNILETVNGLKYTLDCLTDSVNPESTLEWTADLVLEVIYGAIDVKDGSHGGKTYSSKITIWPTQADQNKELVCTAVNSHTKRTMSAKMKLDITYVENQDSLIMWAVAAVGVFLLLVYPLIMWRNRMKRQQAEAADAAEAAREGAGFLGPSEADRERMHPEYGSHDPNSSLAESINSSDSQLHVKPAKINKEEKRADDIYGFLHEEDDAKPKTVSRFFWS